MLRVFFLFLKYKMLRVVQPFEYFYSSNAPSKFVRVELCGSCWLVLCRVVSLLAVVVPSLAVAFLF